MTWSAEMGVISTFGLIYRDFVQYILPTFVGVTLFAPLLVTPGASLDIENLFLLAFVVGYVIFAPAAKLAEFVNGLFYRERVRRLRAVRKWWADNWDYDRLWAALDKDEREYLYATASYINFYRITSLYLLFYALANFALIGRALWAPTSATGVQPIASSILAVQTPMLGNWQAPTWIVTLFALVLCVFQNLNAVNEYDCLFGEEGFYSKFSEKYQLSIGGIARSVWGWLILIEERVETPLAGIKLSLLEANGSQIADAVSGEGGEFQFKGAFTRCMGRPCKINVNDPKWNGMKELNLSEKSIPGVRVVASRTSEA